MEKTNLRHTRAGGFSENGADMFRLVFASQDITQWTGVAGVRGRYGIPLTRGVPGFQSRLEYAHVMNENGRATLGYADISDDNYSMKLIEEVKIRWRSGWGGYSARSTDWVREQRCIR